MIRRYAFRLSIGLVVLGVAGLVSTIETSRSDKAFSDHAATATAKPAGPAPRGQSYQGDLVFTTRDGQPETIPATKVPMAVRDSFRDAGSVEIQYLPEDPANVRFSNWDPPSSPGFLLPGGVIFLGGLAFGVLMKNRR